MSKKILTPSQRLRAVIYLLWEQDNKGFKTSDEYYYDLMERIINHYKTKIDERK